jgi:hypothetical protein
MLAVRANRNSTAFAIAWSGSIASGAPDFTKGRSRDCGTPGVALLLVELWLVAFRPARAMGAASVCGTVSFAPTIAALLTKPRRLRPEPAVRQSKRQSKKGKSLSLLL